MQVKERSSRHHSNHRHTETVCFAISLVSNTRVVRAENMALSFELLHHIKRATIMAFAATSNPKKVAEDS